MWKSNLKKKKFSYDAIYLKIDDSTIKSHVPKMHILHKGSKIESRVSIYVLDLFNTVYSLYNIRYPIKR